MNDPTDAIRQVLNGDIRWSNISAILAMLAGLASTMVFGAWTRAMLLRHRYGKRQYTVDTILVMEGPTKTTEWIITAVHRTHVHTVSTTNPYLRRDIPLKTLLSHPVTIRRHAPAIPTDPLYNHHDSDHYYEGSLS